MPVSTGVPAYLPDEYPRIDSDPTDVGEVQRTANSCSKFQGLDEARDPRRGTPDQLKVRRTDAWDWGLAIKACVFFKRHNQSAFMLGWFPKLIGSVEHEVRIIAGVANLQWALRTDERQVKKTRAEHAVPEGEVSERQLADGGDRAPF